jgi:hypothetical protein
VFAETNTGGYQASLTQNAPWKTSIRTDDFKLIEKNYENRQKEFLFFDLLNDPGENADLYPSMDPAQKGIFDELSGEIGDFKNNNFSFRAALDSEDTKKIIEDSADSQRRNCPEIIIPVHGELISPKESGALIVIEWKGLKEENYVVEYNVGKDPYHLQGTFIVKGRRQEFGPFIGENWNKLTYYNPWSFRVWAESQPGCKSEWVVFNLDKYTSSQVDKGKTENNKAIESFPLFPENM